MRSAVGAFTLFAVLWVGVGRAEALSFSFTGNLSSDDEVLLFNFTVDATSLVTLRSYSYAGGTNAAGTAIARGGFDPILALFNSAGVLLNQQDDAGCSLVPADALTGECWDVSFQQTLSGGSYTVAVMQFDNFANGPNLSNGFENQGQGNFTATFSCPGLNPFQDVSGVSSGCQRDSHWAFDILNVGAASGPGGGGPPPVQVPEPSTLGLLGLGLAIAGRCIRRRRTEP